MNDIEILNKYPVTNKLNWRIVIGTVYCFWYMEREFPDNEYFLRTTNTEFIHRLEKNRSFTGRTPIEGIAILYDLS